MGLLDFSEERRRVDLGGRCFFIHRITVGGVVRVLTLYGREVEAIREAHNQEPGMFQACGLGAALLFFPADERMLEVLRDSVETDVPESRWPLADLALAVAQLSDWPKIIAALTFSDSDPHAAENENRWVVNLAKAVGVTPVEALRWPFEAWVAAAAALQPPEPKHTVATPEAIAAMLGVPSSSGVDQGVQ